MSEALKTDKLIPLHSIGELIRSLLERMTRIPPLLVVVSYLFFALVLEFAVDNLYRHYIYSVFIALSAIFVTWVLGGRRAALWMTFFNLLIVLLFSRLIWDLERVGAGGIYYGRSFQLMYLGAAVLLLLLLFVRSPADVRGERQRQTIEQEKERRKDLEYVVASSKMRGDIMFEANQVKDELLLLEGSWRANLHDLTNELGPQKEDQIYYQTIRPFEEEILRRLRLLEERLSYRVERYKLNELYRELMPQLEQLAAVMQPPGAMTIRDQGWSDSAVRIEVERHKLWDIIGNILQNGRTAVDWMRLQRLRSADPKPWRPAITVVFGVEQQRAWIRINDNGGGIDAEILPRLYREPVLSKKRSGEQTGEGTLFVKFFAQQMGIEVDVDNADSGDGKGLQVTLWIQGSREGMQEAEADNG